MDANKPRRRHVKTGCNTCRRRKVKCDEKKPCCQRCVSSRRICEGYGVWGGGSGIITTITTTTATGIPNQNLALLPIARTPDLVPEASSTDLQVLDYVRLRVVPKFCAVFDSDFWKMLVPQACLSDTLVREATIALGMAYKCREQYSSILYEDDRAGLEENSLRQYARTLSRLQSRLKREDAGVSVSVPVACLIFAALESVRGQSVAARTHIESGSHFFGQILNHSWLRTEIADIGSGFKSLGILDCLVSGPAAPCKLFTNSLENESDSCVVPACFSTLSAARDCLDTLTIRALWLKDQFRGRGMQGPLFTDAPWKLKVLHQAVMDWGVAFRNSLHDIRSKTSHRTLLGLRVLRMTHSMVLIMTQTLFSPEIVFDEHADEFATIIEQALLLWDATGFAVGLAYEGNYNISGPRVAMNAGIMAPLYFTALKCRVPSVRRRAISLLQIARYSEAAWSTLALARILRTVMKNEERGMFGAGAYHLDPFGSAEESRPDRSYGGVVPDSCRFYDVIAVPTTPDGSSGSVRCVGRKGGDGSQTETTFLWDVDSDK